MQRAGWRLRCLQRITIRPADPVALGEAVACLAVTSLATSLVAT